MNGYIKLDGLDDAILGVMKGLNGESCLAYCVEKIIKILMERDGMEYHEAWEFYDFNIAALYAGEGTPMFVHGLLDEDGEPNPRAPIAASWPHPSHNQHSCQKLSEGCRDGDTTEPSIDRNGS
jgi:hypothetical protein